jgi:hypothetical protein
VPDIIEVLMNGIDDATLIESYARLGSGPKVAAEFGMSSATVAYRLKKLGVLKAHKKNVGIELLKSLYSQYQSAARVAQVVGTSPDYVAYTLRDLGVLNSRVRYTCSDDFFSNNTPESFYWAGFIAADGCVKLGNKKYKQLSIGLASTDVGHLRKFKEAVQFSGPVHEYADCVTPRCEVLISSDRMFDDLARFNIVPRKSLTLTFPAWLVQHDLVHHFMRGYNDGDGSFFVQQLKGGRTVNQLMFGLRGTKEFLTTYRDILENKCGFDHNDKKPRANSGIYSLEYGGNRKVLKIRDFLYGDVGNNMVLDRKYDLAFSEQFNLPANFRFKGVIGTEVTTGKELVFGSMQEAEKSGFRYQGISACCRGIQSSYKGYTWSYATQDEKKELLDKEQI